MIKTYAIYNLKNKCLEHVSKIKTNKSSVFYKLDDNVGEIWTTNDVDIAEMVRVGCVKSIITSSKKIPYNPYSADELEIVELDSMESISLKKPPIKKHEEYLVCFA